MLTLRDFILQTVTGSPVQYLSHEIPKYEICIEPLITGYDIALYDSEKSLIGEKIRLADGRFSLFPQIAGDILIKDGLLLEAVNAANLLFDSIAHENKFHFKMKTDVCICPKCLTNPLAPNGFCTLCQERTGSANEVTAQPEQKENKNEQRFEETE